MLANHCERLAQQAFFHQSYSRPLAYHPLAGPDAHGKALGAALLDMALETLQERASSRLQTWDMPSLSRNVPARLYICRLNCAYPMRLRPTDTDGT